MAHPVPNKVLYVEIVKSLEHDELTPKALRLLQKQAKHLSYTKFSYVREADRDDVIAFGLFDVIKYWRGFNPIYTNAFAYYTTMIKNGFAKGFKKLGLNRYSQMVRMDSDHGIYNF
jgi:DNA-directed RNA polymerase specialized sigma subunit